MPRPILRRALSGSAALATVLALVTCDDQELPGASTAPNPSTTSAPDDPPSAPGDLSTPTGRNVKAAFADGAPVGGARTETVALDQQVRIEISGDAPDEIHVHTYDLVDAVSPGSPATFDFAADIPGVHEIELHSSGQVLLELQVEP